MKNLFKPYFKTTDALSREMNTSSHGLGLNICKKIAYGLNGDLHVESEIRTGTKFTFNFDAEVIVPRSL
jgi:signal transduction histidine kinase